MSRKKTNWDELFGNYFNKSKKDKVQYKGRKNKTILPEFVKLCKMEQMKLKEYLINELSKYRSEIYVGNGYVFSPGEDVLLTAHMDTVHKEAVKTYYEEKKTDPETKEVTHILTSPQGIGGDDRCGIYTIMKIVEEGKYNPAILFCEDEEIGGVGSGKFVDSEYVEQIRNLKFYIEIDRRGNNDAVFYDCGNKDFQDFVQEVTGYVENWGTFSDISHLSPETDVASVNLSSGYYKEHTLEESVVIEEMENTIEKVKLLLEAAKDCKEFDYQEVRYGRYSTLFGRGNYNAYDDWYDYYGDYYGGYSSGITGATHGYGYGNTNKYSETYSDASLTYQKSNMLGAEIFYIDRKENGEETTESLYVEGNSLDECFGKFFWECTHICFNDVLDWDVYEDSNQETELVNEITIGGKKYVC